ncbi:MAG: hypothetical protein ABFC90_10255 [Bacteroidales bacterium]|nr:hypothetical protein [Bacteroidales bacterium]
MIDFSKYNVLDILSQATPAVYIDRIVSFDDDSKQLVAEKYIGEDEHLLQGHFPDNPVVPAIFTIEALSQACHLCGFAICESDPHIPHISKKSEHLAIKVNIRFKNKANPKDTLLLQARLVEVVNMVSIFKVKAINKANHKTVAAGEIMGIARIINGEAENQTE